MTSKSANFDSKTVIFNSKNVNFETQKCQFQLQMCEFLFQNRQYLIITMCSYLNILSFFLNVYILSKSEINMQLSTYYFCMYMHNITTTPIGKYITTEEMQ